MPLLGLESGVEQHAKLPGTVRASHLELSRNRIDEEVGLDKEVELSRFIGPGGSGASPLYPQGLACVPMPMASPMFRRPAG